MNRRDNRWPRFLQVVALYLLATILVGCGAAMCLEQILEHGFWPVPIGVVFLALGVFLWVRGTRARFAILRSGEAR